MPIRVLIAVALALLVTPASAQSTKSSSDFAPGQKQTTPGTAKNFAPGQKQKSPGGAKDFAPGQQSKRRQIE